MGTGIGRFFALGKWDLSHWDWNLVTGNGNKNVKNGNGINSLESWPVEASLISWS